MKMITMTEFRSEPGERVRDVSRHGASFLVTKGGKPVARLVPVSESVEVMPDGSVRGDPTLLVAVAEVRRGAVY